MDKNDKNDKNENNEIRILDNCEILITDEDKNGTDISKMSDFFEVGINNDVLNTLKNSTFEIINRFSLSDVSKVDDCVKVIDSLSKKGKVDFIADLKKLPKEIKQKLEKGENVINKSKQYTDRYRPVVENQKSEIQKEIVLKKVVRRANNESAFRNIATQQKLQQIDAKINELNELCSYQIDLQINDMVYKPFVLARSEILNFQTSNDNDDKIKHLENASNYLQSCIAGIYTSIKTSQDHLLKVDNSILKVPMFSMDEYIKNVGRDLSHLTKIVGLQSHVYALLGKDNENRNLIDQYKNSINNFFNKPINKDGESLAILIHNNCVYNKTNKDAWYNMYLQVKELNIDKLDEKNDKEIYYLDEGETNNEQ